MLLLIKLHAKACNFIQSNTPQIARSVICNIRLLKFKRVFLLVISTSLLTTGRNLDVQKTFR